VKKEILVKRKNKLKRDVIKKMSKMNHNRKNKTNKMNKTNKKKNNKIILMKFQKMKMTMMILI
jgi:hypothetical protein